MKRSRFPQRPHTRNGERTRLNTPYQTPRKSKDINTSLDSVGRKSRDLNISLDSVGRTSTNSPIWKKWLKKKTRKARCSSAMSKKGRQH